MTLVLIFLIKFVIDAHNIGAYIIFLIMYFIILDPKFLIKYNILIYSIILAIAILFKCTVNIKEWYLGSI